MTVLLAGTVQCGSEASGNRRVEVQPDPVLAELRAAPVDVRRVPEANGQVDGASHRQRDVGRHRERHEGHRYVTHTSTADLSSRLYPDGFVIISKCFTHTFIYFISEVCEKSSEVLC